VQCHTFIAFTVITTGQPLKTLEGSQSQMNGEMCPYESRSPFSPDWRMAPAGIVPLHQARLQMPRHIKGPQVTGQRTLPRNPGPRTWNIACPTEQTRLFKLIYEQHRDIQESAITLRRRDIKEQKKLRKNYNTHVTRGVARDRSKSS
jgi:hypothetical protein